MSTLRFYLDNGILQCEDFKAQLEKGASCDRSVTSNHVQFSNDFLHLQPTSILSEELLTYLNEKARKVTMLVSTIRVQKVIKSLQPKDGTNEACMAKEFSLKFGDKKISGGNGVNGSFNFLCEAKSFNDVTDLFRSFAPGFFPQTGALLRNYLKGMTFRNKIRLVFGV